MNTTYEGQNPRPASQATPPPPPPPQPQPQLMTPGFSMRFHAWGRVQVGASMIDYMGELTDTIIGGEPFLNVVTPQLDPQLAPIKRFLSMRFVKLITVMPRERVMELLRERHAHPPTGKHG